MGYTTLTDIEGELLLSAGSLNSTSSPTDTQVYGWIAQAEDKINSKTGNIYGNILSSNNILDWEGNDRLLRVEPFTSITTLEYNVNGAGVAASWVTKTEDTDYKAYGEEGEIRFISQNFAPTAGYNKFRLTYFEGQSKVPARVKEIAAKLAANRVVSATVANQASEQSGGSVQVGTIKIEDPTAFSVSAYKSRAQEAKDFFMDDIGSFKAHRVSRAYDL